MPAIYHEGSWLGNATDPEVLVKDTVGWTGKNLLKNTAESGSNQGITYTVNSDKSITINGTNTDSAQHSVTVGIVTLDAGTYKVNGLKNNGGYTSFWINLYNLTDRSNIKDVKNANEDVTFTLSAPKQVRVNVYWAGNATVSNITIYPMIRHADITDPTYEPYHESVEEEIEQIYANNGVLGAKNLLKNNATSQTINGVTFTVNADGSVTANGTATAVANFNISLSISDKLSCILNGCPSGGSDNSYRIGARYNNSGTLTYNYDTGSGCGINDISIVDRIFIQIASGQTVSNITFKPMIRLASDPDDTYQPYAMTNRELTPQIVYNQNNICVCKQGKIVIAQFNGAKPSDIAALNFANMGAKPAFYVNTFQCRCDAKPTTIEINANGTVVNVGYYASYGATYTDLKSDSSKSINGSICFIAE